MRVFLTLVCLLTLGFPLFADAQSQQNALIVVTVGDAATGKPIDSAQVFLLGGDSPQSSLTNAKGLLIFQVQPGDYHVVVKADGYADSSATEVDAAEGQRVNVAVALSPSLPTIASVVARGSVSVTSQDINANSPETKVSQSLLDALGKIAGVNIEDQLYGSDSAFNVSLHGADASQTGYSIDGVQVRGAAAQAISGFQDLFGGASVDFAPSASSPAGMIGFWTAQPSKRWSYHFTGLAGNYANTLGTWTVTGGGGKAAFVAEHAAGGRDYPLDGHFFADSTGAAYVHQGGFSRRTDMFKAAFSLSSVTSLKYSIFGGSTVQSNICSSAVTLLPCGFGSGNITRGSNVMQTLNLSSIAGHLEFNVFWSGSSYHSTTADPNRAVNGIVNPYFGSGSYPWWSAGIYTSASARRHTMSGGFYTTGSGSSFTSTYNAVRTITNTQDERYGSFWLGDRVKANDKLALNYTISQAAGTGAGTNVEVYADGTWQPRTADVFTFGVGAGSMQPPPVFNTLVGDPLTGEYDCQNGSVFVNGPSDQSTKQSSLQYNAGWRHTWKRGQLTVNAYRNQFDGQGIFGSVPFAAEPASIFPNGPAAYLASLQQVWSEPTVCGSTPFDPSRVYVSQYISGLNQVNQGLTVSGRFILSPALEIFPSYSLSSAALSSIDPRLLYPGSYVQAGAQLPHRPLRTAGLTLIGGVGHANVQWAFNAQFTGANNPQNLPAYTVYNAGLTMNLQHGSLRVFESNLFGTHTGLFTTYQGVNPFPVQGGGTFAQSTTPLPPRSFSVLYDIRWQQPAPPKKKKS